MITVVEGSTSEDTCICMCIFTYIFFFHCIVSQLKAQYPVLKKAYLDEQAKVTNLEGILKERDQTVRKYEQEVDSLTFRNQQLSKRVILLQEELETAQANSKKKSKVW